MVGSRIKKIREGLGLSMAQFAKLIDATPGAVNNWEKEVREPGIETLIKIAVVGGKSLDWLMLGAVERQEKDSAIMQQLREHLKEMQDENERLKRQRSSIHSATVSLVEGLGLSLVADKKAKYSAKKKK